MKRLLFLTLLLAIASSRLSAQTGLNVAPLFTKFSGKETPDVTSVTLRGSKVEPYQLSLFRSITFHTTGHTAEVERLVQADARTASYHESGTKSGHLYYGIYQYPIRDGRNLLPQQHPQQKGRTYPHAHLHGRHGHARNPQTHVQ